MADRAGVGYALIRKWRTESRFRNLVRSVTRDYAQEVGRRYIYGDQVNGRIEPYGVFVREEMFNYSRGVVLEILRNKDERKELCKAGAESSIDIRNENAEVLRKIRGFEQVFGSTALLLYGSLSQKTDLLDRLAASISSGLDETRAEFRSALKEGSKKKAQQCFDFLWENAQQWNDQLAELQKIIIDKPPGGKLRDPWV